MPLKWFHTFNDTVTVSVQQNAHDGHSTVTYKTNQHKTTALQGYLLWLLKTWYYVPI